jgi:hypothetical protein
VTVANVPSSLFTTKLGFLRFLSFLYFKNLSLLYSRSGARAVNEAI